MWELFFTFFKIGAFTFGGGYAMIPLIEKQVVEKKGWLSQEEFLNVIAVAESTPGPIAVNVATYVGNRHSKLFGGIFATLGVILPSFLIIFIIASFLWSYRDNAIIIRAFKGIRIAVCVLIINAWWKMTESEKKTPLLLVVMVSCALAVVFFKLSPIALIALGAAAAVIYDFKKDRR